MTDDVMDESAFTIDVAMTADPALLEGVSRLLPQLSSSSPPPTTEDLTSVLAQEATTLLVARDRSNTVVGMLTLALFRLPTGVRAWIEDVVVDESHRGQGIAEALVGAAVSKAGASGARTVDLTSRPDRESANRLYQRVGFEVRATNVYRFGID